MDGVQCCGVGRLCGTEPVVLLGPVALEVHSEEAVRTFGAPDGSPLVAREIGYDMGHALEQEALLTHVMDCVPHIAAVAVEFDLDEPLFAIGGDAYPTPAPRTMISKLVIDPIIEEARSCIGVADVNLVLVAPVLFDTVKKRHIVQEPAVAAKSLLES